MLVGMKVYFGSGSDATSEELENRSLRWKPPGSLGFGEHQYRRRRWSRSASTALGARRSAASGRRGRCSFMLNETTGSPFLERFGVRHRRASSGSMGGRTARGPSRGAGPDRAVITSRCAAPGRSPARRPRRRAARTGAIPPRCGRTRPHSEPPMASFTSGSR